MKSIVLLSLLGLGAYALLSGGSSVGDTHGGSSGAGIHVIPTRVGGTLGPPQPSITYNFPQEPALPAINLKSPAQAFGSGGGGSYAGATSVYTGEVVPNTPPKRRYYSSSSSAIPKKKLAAAMAAVRDYRKAATPPATPKNKPTPGQVSARAITAVRDYVRSR